MPQQLNLKMDAVRFNENLLERNRWNKRVTAVKKLSYFDELRITECGDSGIHSYSIILPDFINNLLNDFAVSQPAKHATLLAALAIMIQKYHDNAEAMIFTSLPENHSSCNKILPAYVSISPDEIFSTSVKRIFSELQDDICHEQYAVERFERESGGARGMVALSLSDYQLPSAFDSYCDIILFTIHKHNTLTVRANKKNISYGYLKFIAELYLFVLDQLCVSSFTSKISDIKLLSESCELTQLEALNGGEALVLGASTLISHFRQSAQDYASKVAQRQGGFYQSYEELDLLSNKFAFYLRENKGVKTGDLIGVLLTRELRLLPVLLGIMKAGAAFVPIEAQWPVGRMRSVIADSGMHLLVSLPALAGDLEIGATGFLDIDQEWYEILRASGRDINYADRSTLAYVIYTSGSTGQPKGVMISHESLYNYISWANLEYVQGRASVFPLYTSIAFDLTITSLFTPLLSGNTIALYDGSESSLQIDRILSDNISTILKLTPSHLKLIRDNYTVSDLVSSKLETLIIGGEALDRSLAQSIDELFEGRVSLYNEYGPTEATVGCMIYRYRSSDVYNTVSIGKAGASSRIYVLDGNYHPVAAGAAGEIYIAGKCLAMGYLNNEALTAEKFIVSPFKAGELMYKTGDIGVPTLEGTLLYKGRKDMQMQLHGYRIEPEEISGLISRQPNVKESYVNIWKNKGDDYLVAYYAGEATEVQLRTVLQSELPTYMQPSYFVRLEVFPLTVNGKLDQEKLPAPEIKALSGQLMPEGETEELLAEIWAAVLKVDKTEIGALRSFFELGGNSIKILALNHRIFDLFNIELALSRLFKNNTIQSQAKLIQEQTAIPLVTQQQIPEKENHVFYEASPAQQRMYFQQQANPLFTGFNICRAFKISQRLSDKQIHRYFEQLVQRHESLRTNFLLIDGQVKQIIKQDTSFAVELLAEHDDRNLDNLIKHFVKPFNLSKGPLLRLGLTRHIKSNDQILFFDVHHIAADGYSLNILVADLLKIILGEQLPGQSFQYRHYTEYLKNNNSLEKQKLYWQTQLGDNIPVVTLPKITDNEYYGNYEASSCIETISSDLYSQLKLRMLQTQTTTFTYFLTIFYILLYKITANTDLIVGSDSTGRVLPQFSSVIGTFVNILPLRQRLNPALPFEQLLNEVRSLVLNALDNQEFQFEQMVELISRPGNERGNPIVNIHFSTADVFTNSDQLGKLHFEPIECVRELFSQYEFKVEVRHRETEIDIAFIYLNGLFEEEIIKLILKYYIGLIKSSITTPLLSIKDTVLQVG